MSGWCVKYSTLISGVHPILMCLTRLQADSGLRHKRDIYNKINFKHRRRILFIVETVWIKKYINRIEVVKKSAANDSGRALQLVQNLPDVQTLAVFYAVSGPQAQRIARGHAVTSCT